MALPETNTSHLKIDGWKTSLSFWGKRLFSGGALLVSGRLNVYKYYLKINGFEDDIWVVAIFQGIGKDVPTYLYGKFPTKAPKKVDIYGL